MARFKALYRRLGWLDRVFLAVLAAALVYNQAFPDSQGGVLLTFLAFVLAVVLAFKWLVVLLRKVIWRLRYRLLVAYLFIAVVPILLILVLVWFGTYVLTGSAATPPRIVDPQRGTVTGASLIFNSRDDSVSVEGNGRGTATETAAPKRP